MSKDKINGASNHRQDRAKNPPGQPQPRSQTRTMTTNQWQEQGVDIQQKTRYFYKFLQTAIFKRTRKL
jgi:hypothetical protein